MAKKHVDRSEDFAVDALLAEARAAAGLDDFGDEVFLEPLGVLAGALTVAPLNDLGAMIIRGGLVRSLVQRLRASDYFARLPEITDETITAPIVVVGMMRSGTTMVQRLLASDPAHYCVYGWEVGEPAPRPGWDPSAVDRRIADAVERDEQTRVFFPELMAIHPTDAHEAEEEIMFLADAFLSHVHEAYANVPTYRSWLDDQDFTPAYRHLRRMLQLLQWQKKQRGERADRWVLKTPAHLGYLDTLLDHFPDAHIVHMHRDPVDTIPSGASLNTTLWRMHADAADVDPAEVGRQWIERMSFTNDRAMVVRTKRPNGRFTDIEFGALMADPISSMARVYSEAGIAFTEEAREAMVDWLGRNQRDKLPTHRYTAADFGLTDHQIRSKFSAYIDRYLRPQGD